MANELAAARRWLLAHANSPHTRRKYDAQLQQLCEWLLVRGSGLAQASSADLQAYLTDFAAGALSNSKRSAPLSRASVTQARSVICSLFDSLVREGVRATNPAWATHLPSTAEPAAAPTLPAGSSGLLRWLDVRVEVLERARADATPRGSLRRAVVIAELASWSGLRRSELAAATMDDFVQMNRRWWIRMARFGHGDIDMVEVPQPAMQALSLYRACRGLAGLPAAHEGGVPLIVSTRSEQPVRPWTIAHALKELAATPNRMAAKSVPAIVALRREVASEALKARIVTHQLARHLRSKRLIDQVARALAPEPIAEDLERLVA